MAVALSGHSDSERVVDRIIRLLTVALALVPFLATALLIVFAWHTSRSFGAWPSYSQPDPKTANGVLYISSGVLILASLPSVVTLSIGLPMVRRLRLTPVDFGLVVLGLVGLAVLYVVFAGNLGDWYMD